MMTVAAPATPPTRPFAAYLAWLQPLPSPRSVGSQVRVPLAPLSKTVGRIASVIEAALRTSLAALASRPVSAPISCGASPTFPVIVTRASAQR